MWHTICLCLPAVTRSEQQRFFALFKFSSATWCEETTGL
jgi:hypothetical protein